MGRASGKTVKGAALTNDFFFFLFSSRNVGVVWKVTQAFCRLKSPAEMAQQKGTRKPLGPPEASQAALAAIYRTLTVLQQLTGKEGTVWLSHSKLDCCYPVIS